MNLTLLAGVGFSLVRSKKPEESPESCKKAKQDISGMLLFLKMQATRSVLLYFCCTVHQVLR